MSRTFRRDESGRKSLDTRRAKKREKANSHYTDVQEDYKKFCDERGRRPTNLYYDLCDLDTDED